MKKKKSVLKKTSNVILTIVLFVLVFVIAITLITRITGSTPSLFSYSIYRVSTGSMEPDLMVGDVILSKQVDDINSLSVGDVITYKGVVGEYKDMLITHKIVKAPYEEKGITYVVTKGVANSLEDEPVQEGQIVGKFVCKIPLLNAIYSFFLTPWGLLTAILLIVIAFAGEFWNIFKLSHQKEKLPDVGEIDDETLQKAIEQYKSDNPKDSTDDSQASTENNPIKDSENSVKDSVNLVEDIENNESENS